MFKFTQFTGWIEGNVLCDFLDCGTALNTNDNSLNFAMTSDVAYLAEKNGKIYNVQGVEVK